MLLELLEELRIVLQDISLEGSSTVEVFVVEIGALLEEDPEGLEVFLGHSKEDRCAAFLVGQFEVSSLLNEHSHSLVVGVVDGSHERGPAERVLEVEIGAFLEEKRNKKGKVLIRTRSVKGCFPVLVDFIEPHSSLDQINGLSKTLVVVGLDQRVLRFRMFLGRWRNRDHIGIFG